MPTSPFLAPSRFPGTIKKLGGFLSLVDEIGSARFERFFLHRIGGAHTCARGLSGVCVGGGKVPFAVGGEGFRLGGGG